MQRSSAFALSLSANALIVHSNNHPSSCQRHPPPHNASLPHAPQICDSVKIASAAFLASSTGNALPGISATELLTAPQVYLNFKDFISGFKDVHALLYPAADVHTKTKDICAFYSVSFTVFKKWKDFLFKDFFPNGFSGNTGAHLALLHTE